MADSQGAIAIVGLGYVGLPLAVAFGRNTRTIGIDLNEQKLADYRTGYDPSGEVSREDLIASSHLEFTSDASSVAGADVVIIVVPTPIDEAHRPDLSPLQNATKSVAPHIKAGTIVVFESTVYPGCTEEVCVPILEEGSGMQWAGGVDAVEGEAGFFVGYSPERINPGDKVHRLETITKVVSGDTADTLEKVANIYESIVDAGVHRAATIKVAEAAKVIENTQRDLNIALMNELAMIFNKLDIDTSDVLEAAGTKWNFLPFRPGLVGGHCIGVDPYYLTFKAESVGHHPQVVLGGRMTNDGMGKFIAEQAVKQMASRNHPISGSCVTVLGLTFKENCPDLRNSRVEDIITELQSYGLRVQVADPLADAAEAVKEYGVTLVPWEELEPAPAVVFAVPHTEYMMKGAEGMASLLSENGVIIDVKSVLDRQELSRHELPVWRL